MPHKYPSRPALQLACIALFLTAAEAIAADPFVATVTFKLLPTTAAVPTLSEILLWCLSAVLAMAGGYFCYRRSAKPGAFFFAAAVAALSFSQPHLTMDAVATVNPEGPVVELTPTSPLFYQADTISRYSVAAPLGSIFLGSGSTAPSFIAQVFGSEITNPAVSGFLGFGASDAGIFGSSTFATVFSREVPGVSELTVFNSAQWRTSDLSQGLRGVFGAPTFGHSGPQDPFSGRQIAACAGETPTNSVPTSREMLRNALQVATASVKSYGASSLPICKVGIRLDQSQSCVLLVTTTS